MGYHQQKIMKGDYKFFSKVEEEFQELKDAYIQGAKILQLIEICDLYGALEGYVEENYNLTMADVKQMSDLTKKAFDDGTRK